jgi:hypothetical protein
VKNAQKTVAISIRAILVMSLLIFISCKKEENSLLTETQNEVSGNQSLGIYPHTEEFKTSSLHGTTFFANRASCTKCHGNDYKGGSTKVSCLSCHNYPHEVKWAQPKNHGTYFVEMSARQSSIKDPLKRNLSECMMCHENKIDPTGTFKERHPEQFTSCSTCHADAPHGQKFFPSLPTDKGPISHGIFARNHPELKNSCFSCHLNPERRAPKVAETCLECHEGEGPPFEPKAEDK